MAHFGYTYTKGIVGEVASTAEGIRRTFTANEDIPFGSIVVIDPPAGQPASRLIKKQTALRTQITIGVAAYQPDHSKGHYVKHDSVTVITEGDVRVKVREGDSFRAGDFVFIGRSIDTGPIEFSSDPHIGDTVYGTFTEGGESTSGNNSFNINFRPCNRRILGS